MILTTYGTSTVSVRPEDKLNDDGIETGTDLVEYSAEELADIVSVNVSTAQKWLRQFDSDATLTSDMKLGYRYLREKILGATMERAGIDKPSNPHHYRHSRASYLVTEMTEAKLCEWFGWVQGSNVPAKYVHLSGRDTLMPGMEETASIAFQTVSHRFGGSFTRTLSSTPSSNRF